MSRKKRMNDRKIVEREVLNERIPMERTGEMMPTPNFMRPAYGTYQSANPTTMKAVDEFGRVYQPSLYYCPLPNSNPVPVPIPSPIVQITPIITPIAMVPYATQNQPLFQIEEE